MLLDLAMIALGIVTVLWARLLLPQQMREMSARTRDGVKERYEEPMPRSTVARLVVAPTIMGSILVVTGFVLWLTE